MARFWFGGGIADWTFTTVDGVGGIDDVAQVVGGATVTFWNAESGGTQYTDLLDDAGATVQFITSADGTTGRAVGQIPPFQGPDGVRELWAEASGGPRDMLVARVDAVLASRQVIAGEGLSGGGDLSVDRTLSVAYGTTAGTVAAGDDPRIVEATDRGNDLMLLTTLADVASADRQRSLAASQAAMADAASFVEPWANLTAWSSSTFAQVSGGRLYSASQAGNSGANHAFALAANETLRAVVNVRSVSGGPSGGVIVGVTSDAPGGAFTAGGGKMTGLYFRGDISSLKDGVATVIGAMPAGTVDWTVTLTVDAAYLSVVAVRSDGSQEFRYKTARPAAVNNLAVFNSDSRNLAGHSIGLLGARKGLVTVTPRAGIEDVQRTVHWTTAATDKGVRIALPPSYDSRRPSPLAICFHGNGSDENLFADNANGRVVANALNAAGYIVLSAAYTPNTSTWGAQPGLDAYVEAYRAARDRYAIGPVVFYANSMGGVESLLTLRERRIPAVAWAGTSPAASLADAYANLTFTSAITAAYGINAGNPYAAATAEHDPVLGRGWEFRGVPMLFIAATDDTVIPKAQHTDVMAALVGASADVTVISTVGGHSFDFTPHVGTIVDFFNAHAFG